MSTRKLTIGIYTHDDYDGVRYLIDSIRLNDPDILSDIEFSIIDNCPGTPNSDAIIEYLKTAVKNVAFSYNAFGRYSNHIWRFEAVELAKTPYVVVVESKLQFAPGALKALINFFDAGLDNGLIITGPRIKDDFSGVLTHFRYAWDGEFYGIAEKDERADTQTEAFEIEGLLPGLFAVRKDSFFKIPKGPFAGNGIYGEDVVLSLTNFVVKNKRALCLPALKWSCRMVKASGSAIPDSVLNRFHNYSTAFLLLDAKDKLAELKSQFANSISEERMSEIISKCKLSLNFKQ